MTRTQKHALRASLLELARLVAGVLLMAAAMAFIPFLFAVR